MSKHTNPVQKVWIFFENRKVLKLFRFSYKIAKTANSKTAITSYNTWIWRLKFGLRVQNESYSILFTHFFDFKRKWFHVYRANNYITNKNYINISPPFLLPDLRDLCYMIKNKIKNKGLCKIIPDKIRLEFLIRVQTSEK